MSVADDLLAASEGQPHIPAGVRSYDQGGVT